MSPRDSSAIEIDGGRFVRIRQNDIEIQQLARPLVNNTSIGKQPAIFSQASDVLIEQNVIRCYFARRSESALGGIQIGGGSERVDIHRNVIEGGNGNGITLGSFHWLTQFQWGLLLQGNYLDALNGALPAGAGFGLLVDPNGCIHIVPDPKGPPGIPLQPVSDGNLSDIRIVDNEIRSMGTNGIATIRLMSDQMSLIEVVDCQIEQNRIYGCLQHKPGIPQQSLHNITAAFGGVILAGVMHLTLRNNWIRENGINFIVPTCGVFIQVGVGVVIEGNQIEDNGPLGQTADQPTAGARAGIYLNMVYSPQTSGLAATGLAATFVLQFAGGFPAARITDNVVIAPMGPALFASANGTIMAEANHFASYAADPTAIAGGSFFAGSTVWILNLGKPSGMGRQKIDYTNLGRIGVAGIGTTISRPLTWSNGLVLCNDNQVLFAPQFSQQALLLTSLFIQSSDDVALADNQCQCISEDLAVMTNAFVHAFSARTADNRFAEQPQSVVLSAVTMAHMNSTTDNQGTHCFLVAGVSALTVRQPNHSLLGLSSSVMCDDFAKRVNQLFSSAGLTTV